MLASVRSVPADEMRRPLEEDFDQQEARSDAIDEGTLGREDLGAREDFLPLLRRRCRDGGRHVACRAEVLRGHVLQARDSVLRLGVLASRFPESFDGTSFANWTKTYQTGAIVADNKNLSYRRRNRTDASAAAGDVSFARGTLAFRMILDYVRGARQLSDE